MHDLRHYICVTMGFICVNLTKYGKKDVMIASVSCTQLDCVVPSRDNLVSMALKFAANISFTFLEHKNFLDRYQAAKRAGDELEYIGYDQK